MLETTFSTGSQHGFCLYPYKKSIVRPLPPAGKAAGSNGARAPALEKSTASPKGSPCCGAANRGRTGTVLLPKDFKSFVSAYSTIAAHEVILPPFPRRVKSFCALPQRPSGRSCTPPCRKLPSGCLDLHIAVMPGPVCGLTRGADEGGCSAEL